MYIYIYTHTLFSSPKKQGGDRAGGRPGQRAATEAGHGVRPRGARFVHEIRTTNKL